MPGNFFPSLHPCWRCGLACLLVGCASHANQRETGPAGPSPGPFQPPTAHFGIRARTALRFERALYYKPRRSDSDEDPPRLGPLLIQELAPRAPAADAPRLARALNSAKSQLSTRARQPAVYISESVAQFGGRSCRRLSYLWSVAADPADGPPVWRGVRMTLDSAGMPAVWEVFGPTDGLAVLYVSRSLNARAEGAYGGPLPGRAFAVERPIDEQPAVVVARLLDDGPVPMGPFVYLDATARRITTLLCRCMSSQLDEAVETVEYELLPLESLREPGRRANRPTRLPVDPNDLAPLPEMADPAWLERALRLPPNWP